MASETNNKETANMATPTRKRSAEREQFLADVLVTAVEGGTGYWAQVSGYHWADNTPENPHAAAKTRVTLHDMEEGGKEHKVTIETIAHGLGVLKNKLPLYYEAGIREADQENDAGEIDAGDADNIVQAGLFGDVIYG